MMENIYSSRIPVEVRISSGSLMAPQAPSRHALLLLAFRVAKKVESHCPCRPPAVVDAEEVAVKRPHVRAAGKGFGCTVERHRGRGGIQPTAAAITRSQHARIAE